MQQEHCKADSNVAWKHQKNTDDPNVKHEMYTEVADLDRKMESKKQLISVSHFTSWIKFYLKYQTFPESNVITLML